jgi:hypothetical protein
MLPHAIFEFAEMIAGYRDRDNGVAALSTAVRGFKTAYANTLRLTANELDPSPMIDITPQPRRGSQALGCALRLNNRRGLERDRACGLSQDNEALRN